MTSSTTPRTRSAGAPVATSTGCSAAPLSRTTSVQKCGEVFVKGIERRRERIYCPGWVGLIRWFKPVLTTRVGQAPVLKNVPQILPQMDQEVVALKRSLGSRTGGLKKK